MEALDHLDALSVNTTAEEPDETEESPQPEPEPVSESQAEPEPDPDPEPEPEPEPQPAPDPDPDPESESTSDSVPETDSDDFAGNATDVFARLRLSQAATESQSAPEPVLEPPENPESDVEADPESMHDPTTDSSCAARERAGDAAAKAMKKVLVEEQGSLLDGIRRGGASAMAGFDEDESHDASYDEAAMPALRELCVALGGPSELDLTPALANIHVLALDPVRRRLADISQQFDGEEELSDAVRALYRETRSRHVNQAASAASVAVDGLVKIDKARQGKANRTVRWVVTVGGSCGADCADNALAGEVLAGDEFPTGDRYPPAHPMCNCRLEV